MDHPADAGPIGGRLAHRAGAGRGIHHRAGKVALAQPPRGIADRRQFRMCGRITIEHDAATGLADNLAVADDDRTIGPVALVDRRLTHVVGAAHEGVVVCSARLGDRGGIRGVGMRRDAQAGQDGERAEAREQGAPCGGRARLTGLMVAGACRRLPLFRWCCRRVHGWFSLRFAGVARDYGRLGEGGKVGGAGCFPIARWARTTEAACKPHRCRFHTGMSMMGEWGEVSNSGVFLEAYGIRFQLPADM